MVCGSSSNGRFGLRCLPPGFSGLPAVDSQFILGNRRDRIARGDRIPDCPSAPPVDWLQKGKVDVPARSASPCQSILVDACFIGGSVPYAVYPDDAQCVGSAGVSELQVGIILHRDQPPSCRRFSKRAVLSVEICRLPAILFRLQAVF